jgi:paraquat-inducible protein B
VRVFVQAPYDQYVTPSTRFWQASGVDMSLSANGLTVQTQSLLSILIGGIAFETPATGPLLSPAEAETQFQLFTDRAQAFAPVPVNPQHYLLVFDQSVHGLTVGAPVEFKGIRIGEVTAVRAQFDEQTSRFSVPVTVQIDPARFGVKLLGITPEENVGAAHRRIIDAFVARGLRAQLQSGSLLTGSLMVVLDVFRDVPEVGVDWGQDPPRFPTVPGQIQAIEANVASIIKKVDSLPFGAIGDDVKKTLVGLDQTLAGARGTLEKLDGTLGKVDATVGSANQLLQPDSLLGASLGTTLEEVNRAARSLRTLADYLERHPESLLRGKGK